MANETNGIRIGLELEKRRLAAGQQTRLYGAVTLTAPRYVPEQRPPLDLVACIDVSGSMGGEKIRSAREALRALVNNLDDQDRLALVAFSHDAHLIAPLTRTDREGRRELHERVRRFEATGSTHMSDGAVLSLRQLRDVARRVEGRDALRRVLVFTDGHANAGIDESDRAGWHALFAQHLGTSSASWFGFGEDHDPEFLAALADETRGNSYLARDAQAIGSGFAKELGALIGTVARDVRIRLRTAGAVPVVLNDEKVERDGDAIVVTLPDLTSQETRPIAFEWPVAPGPLGEARKAVEVEVSWTDVRSGRSDSTRLDAHVEFVAAGNEDAPSKTVLYAVAEQRGANAQQQAAALADRGDTERARTLVLEAAQFAERIGSPEGDKLAERLKGLAEEYADFDHFVMHKAALKSIQRSSSKRRSSGSRYDGETTSDVQAAMMAAFQRPPRRGQ